ncbi:MAG TPA: Crp/Fnr family transcriptional regulator [Puia sp.]|nr:Crp/Fnr family transcriptional regulator [Puia sp.]
MKEILQYLSQTYWKLSEEAMNFVLLKCDEYTKPKGEILLEEGKVCKHVWFIKKGMLRAYQENSPDNDKPTRVFTNWFMKEGDIATSVNSFFNERPADEVIVAAEETVVFQMSRKDLFAGIERFPSIAILTLFIVIRYYCETRFNETCLRMKEPQFIYQRMLAQCPEILQRALQGDIATFLGVSEPVYRDIKSGKSKQKAK